MRRFEITYLPNERDNKLGFLGAPLTEIILAQNKEEAIASWKVKDTKILDVKEVRR